MTEQRFKTPRGLDVLGKGILSTGGTLALGVAAATFWIDTNGNVGIGSSNPARKLDVRAGADGAVAQFRAGGTRQLVIGASSTTPYLNSENGDGLALQVNGVEYARLASSGALGIGIAAPEHKVDVAWDVNSTQRMRLRNVNAGSAAATMLHLANDIDYAFQVMVSSSTATVPNLGTLQMNAGPINIAAGGTNSVRFTTASVERARVDENGRFLVTTNASRSIGGAQRTLQVETATQASISTTRNTADATGPTYVFGKTRAAAIGGLAAVVSGDELGSIQFAGADGTTVNTLGAAIQAYVDNTVSTGVVPGRIDFMTAQANGTMAVRMRLDSLGNVSFGSTTPTNYTGSGYRSLIVNGTSGSIIELQGNGVQQARITGWSNSLAIHTGDVERLRVASTGYVGIGTTNPTQLLDVQMTSDNSMIRARNSTTGMEAKLGTMSTAAYLDAGNADLALLRNGTEVMRLNGANVGIGTTSAAVRLQVNADIGGGAAYFQANTTPTGNQRLWMIGFGGGTDVAKARIEAYSASAWTAGTSTPTYIGFNTTPTNTINSVERMRIDQDGNVGIGGTPTAKLHVFQTTAGVDTLMIRATNGTVSSALTPGGLRADGGGPLQFFQGPTEAMRIDTNLNVVIGTASRVLPSKLNVQDSMSISNTSGTQYLLMGNQNSGGANTPTLLRASNGVLAIGVGDNWSATTGGTMSVALSISGTAVDVSKAMTVLAPTADLNPATKKYVDDIAGNVEAALNAILGV